MRVALDAMGGDHAPGPIVAGAVQAVAEDPELRVVLAGDRSQIEACLTREGAASDRLDVFHCTQVVTMEESPVVAPLAKGTVVTPIGQSGSHCNSCVRVDTPEGVGWLYTRYVTTTPPEE